MPTYRKEEIAEAERRLSQLKTEIRNADEKLTGIRSDIKEGLREQTKQREQHGIAQQQFDTEMSVKKSDFSDVIKEAQVALDTIHTRYADKTAELEAQQGKLDVLRAEYQQATDGHDAIVDARQTEIRQFESNIESQQSRLFSATTKADAATKKREALEEKLVAGEQAFGVRSMELRKWVRDWQHKLHKIQNEFKAYEESLKNVREKDEIRARDLKVREENLASRQRALNKERRELTEEKSQFYHTKEL